MSRGWWVGNLPARPNGGVWAYVTNRAKDAKKLAAARKRLVDAGTAEALVATFPPEQVILLDEVRELHARFDEIARFMVFPPWQFEAQSEKRNTVKREPALIAEALVPAQSSVQQAQGRIAQRFALLRHVEALRLHAAEHKGSLPSSLSDVSVPLPDDPFTGKPFRYELKGATAHIRGTPPKSGQDNRFLRVHYEITLR